MITFNEYLNEADKNFVAKSYFERLCKKYKFNTHIYFLFSKRYYMKTFASLLSPYNLGGKI